MSKTLSKSICMAIIIANVFASCVSVKQASYFANVNDTSINVIEYNPELLIQKNDILSIHISSLNNEASTVFNNPNGIATSNTTSSGNNNNASGYLVNPDGYIQIPMIGMVKASGITKKQLKNNITNIIEEKKLLLDPIVTIRHLNYEVTIIGEVGKPTVINVPNENISLLKALGIAEDITVYGKKENVLLIREQNGKRDVRTINLNSKSFLTSPYYYLQPNDVVYVEPNKQKIIAANRNQQILPTILSVLSIMTIAIAQAIRSN